MDHATHNTYPRIIINPIGHSSTLNTRNFIKICGKSIDLLGLSMKILAVLDFADYAFSATHNRISKIGGDQ